MWWTSLFCYMYNIKIRKKFQICFFVTNTTFLEQQTKLIEKFVGHHWKVVFLSGITNTPIAETIKAYDVVVITPQLIVSVFPYSNFSVEMLIFILLIVSTGNLLDNFGILKQVSIKVCSLKHCIIF